MDTGAAHRVVDPAAAAPAQVGAKKRPADMTDGWTGTKKNKAPCSCEYEQVHVLEGRGSNEANPATVVRSRKRPYEYTELELDVLADPEKMFKCNYWEDPAYAKRLEYMGLMLARSVALDHACDRLFKEIEARHAGAAATRNND